MPRVVVSLTTTPPRLRHLPALLETLERQTLRPDAVHLWLCRRYRRWEQGLSEDDAAAAVGGASGVDVRWGPDRGPFTKLAGTLALERDPETVIVTLDDDRRLPERWLEGLVGAIADEPRRAAVYRGRRLRRGPDGEPVLDYRASRIILCPPAATAVDLVTGAMGAAYPRSVLGEGEEMVEAWERVVAGSCPDMFYVDDMWLSGWLARCGVPRAAVPLPGGLVGRPMWRRDRFVNRRAHRCAPLFRVNRRGPHNDAALRYFAEELGAAAPRSVG